MRRLLLASLLLAACFPRARVPEQDRQRLVKDLANQRRFVKSALYAGPFYGDRGRALLSDQPFGELELLETTDGRTITPPKAERVVPPGTPVKIRAVEFPTGWIISKRVLMTPRYNPWVYLEVPGDRREHVIVLPQTAANYDDVVAELERYLGASDPTPLVEALPPEHRDAIGRKELVEDMEARAVEMAWGYPEKKHIDRPAQTEEWTWPGGKRKAYFEAGKLVRWEPR